MKQIFLVLKKSKGKEIKTYQLCKLAGKCDPQQDKQKTKTKTKKSVNRNIPE